MDRGAVSRRGCATVERLRSGEHVPGQVAALTADCCLDPQPILSRQSSPGKYGVYTSIETTLSLPVAAD